VISYLPASSSLFLIAGEESPDLDEETSISKATGGAYSLAWIEPILLQIEAVCTLESK
jgi:hypothetical protein